MIQEPQSLSKSEVKAILIQGEVKKNEELSRRHHDDIFEFPDGRILYVAGNMRGAIWPSVDALRQYSERRVSHILEDAFSMGPEFVKQIPQLVTKLSELTEVPLKKLDYSLESLKKLDKKVFRKRNNPPFYMTGRFEPLLAYFGEVLRKEIGGDWDMRLGSDGKTWEPWLVKTTRGEIKPYELLWRELCDTPQPGSLFATVLVEKLEKR